jgi:predicted nucleic acid-binding protein
LDRLSLDANVLFSAAYRESSGLRQLWQVPSVQLLTSRFALEEARRNLTSSEQRRRLESLVERIELVDEPLETKIPAGVELPDKDVPIPAAALAHGASHLLTGDRRDFGALFGTRVGDLVVLTPRGYLRAR